MRGDGGVSLYLRSETLEAPKVNHPEGTYPPGGEWLPLLDSNQRQILGCCRPAVSITSKLCNFWLVLCVFLIRLVWWPIFKDRPAFLRMALWVRIHQPSFCAMLVCSSTSNGPKDSVKDWR